MVRLLCCVLADEHDKQPFHEARAAPLPFIAKFGNDAHVAFAESNRLPSVTFPGISLLYLMMSLASDSQMVQNQCKSSWKYDGA